MKSMVKIKSNFITLILLLTLINVTAVIAAVSQPGVTVVPDSTNYYADYDITTSTGNGNTALDPPYDSVYVLFDTTTVMPASINPSLITINSTAVNAVIIRGQLLVLPTPVSVANNGGSIFINIAAAAKIRNPNDEADHFLYAYTTGTQDVTPVISGAYSFVVSMAPVSAAAVTPNPSVATLAAAYTIGFDIGGGGYLDANNSSISIAFDTATTVPNGAISGVLVNGTSANAIANNDVVVITSPVNVDNFGSVEVIFSSGSGLANPALDGSYNLSVRTSTQPVWAQSESYSISPAGVLSISAISAKPDTVNQSGAFAFEVVTGSSGALTAGAGIFSVIFEPNTYIPASIATGNVTISSGGFSDNPTSVTVTYNDPNPGYTTVDLTTPFDIGNSANVSISFASAAGYTNPSIAGSYQLELATSVESAVTSNPFSVFATTTTISQPLVTPTDPSIATATSYSISFNLGRLGRLDASVSTITVTFPSSFTISETAGEYTGSTISVAGGGGIAITSVAASNTSKTVQVTVPSGAVTANGDNIVLNLINTSGTGAQPITNPGTAGDYQVGVKTSVEMTSVNSATFSIGGSAITINSVTLGDYTVNNATSYSFNITTTLKLQSTNNDFVKIVFPQGTVLPASISTANMTVGGQAPKSPISVNQSTRTVTAYITQNNLNPGTFNVVLTAAANIANPAVPSPTFYKVTMNTSQDTRLVTSVPYNIIGDNTTQPTIGAISVNPAVVDASNVVYTVNFTTSATGKLVGGAAAGSSTITVQFDTGTILPASITPSNVEVNATPAQAVSVSTNGPSGGGTVTVTLPNGMTIANSTSAAVQFKNGAGLVNGPVAATYKISVSSSSDLVYSSTTGTAGDYTILSDAALSFTSVTPNPTAQNAGAGYSIKFTTGSTGALSSGSTIQLTFPDNTALPTNLSTSDITINSVNPTNAAVAGQVVTLTLGATPAIGNISEVTILINQSAGILNPTLTGSYTIDLTTTAEGPVTSPAYNISQTSTTVTAANVSPLSVIPSDYTTYTVDFNVGARGRLITGTSTITVTFNSSTNVNGTNTNYTATYIDVGLGQVQIPTANISINGRAVTMTVPAGVSVNNNDAVSLEIGGTNVLQNPGTAGDYTLQVKTSVEVTNITSNTYTITSASAVTGISVALDNYEANAEALNTVDFQVQNPLTGGSGTITIKFPDNTLIPASMTVSQVQVAYSATSPATGYANAQAVVTSPATRTVTLTVPATIIANDYVSVRIFSSTGITNPSNAGDYTAQVKTSSQNVYGTSATYQITSPTSTIINLSVAISPSTPNVIAQYTYSFTTGAQGRLISGSSILYLLVPNDATFTLGVPALSKVTVNGIAAGALSINTGSNPGYSTLEVTVPSSLTIGNSTAVTVVIDQTAGLRNATTAAPLTYEVYSSVEAGDTFDYSLPVELTSFSSQSESGVNYLRWVTESELENAYWMIERKTLTQADYASIQKGEISVEEHPTPFEIISTVEGRGSVSLKTEYVFKDSLVEAGSVYAYRLADVSYDGVVNYHDVIFQSVEAPLTFQLFNNYPNPFNPSTNFKYSLPVDARVEMKIYNLLGQEVTTLVDDVQKAGFHQLQWHGTNRAGESVASGMYVVAFRANESSGGSHTKLMKILLIK